MRPKDSPPPRFKTEEERMEEYWKDHKLFKEKKKE
jgi:hypothetical protein